jgi:hypothetical protein
MEVQGSDVHEELGHDDVFRFERMKGRVAAERRRRSNRAGRALGGAEGGIAGSLRPKGRALLGADQPAVEKNAQKDPVAETLMNPPRGVA